MTRVERWVRVALFIAILSLLVSIAGLVAAAISVCREDAPVYRVTATTAPDGTTVQKGGP